MITNIFLFIIAFISILILVISIRMKSLLDNLINKKRRNIIIKICLIGSSLFLLFSFFAPYFFTSTVVGKSIITTEETGLIGDTMGGIMNPFIAIGGIVLTFLAFYIQYQANKQVQDQFKLQQFESQFYEMLTLHKDNINEMKIEGYEFDNKGIKNRKDTTGRKIFYTMNTELICIYLIGYKIYLDTKTTEDNDDEFFKLNNNNDNNIHCHELFILSYVIFFRELIKLNICIVVKY